MTQKPVPGQRWVSDTEPELGLGIVLKVEFGRLEIFFPAAGEHRQYAPDSAPVRRVQFAEGDVIRTHEDEEFSVESVHIENDGLLIYRCGGRQVPEAELSDTISFSKPEDRLMGGQVDELPTYDLRVETLLRQARFMKSPVRGFLGGRVDLLPHQMGIASEVAGRLAPRVLLADEVGLGKTIEAGLILHRLHLLGKADRILVLLPEPLLHQWFVELLRKFNLLFSLFDEERCTAIEAGDPEANPFLDSQLILCSTAFATSSAKRSLQLAEAGWDLLIVDEAHHLEWSPEAPGASYSLVAEIAGKTPSVLLLTATPEQLGPEGHFARLRLLDPDRYSDLPAFLEESAHYTEVASAIDNLLEGKLPSPVERELFAARSPRVAEHLDAFSKGDDATRDKLIAEIIDSFGTGRVLFRNTRAALSGFPGREPHLIPLAHPEAVIPEGSGIEPETARAFADLKAKVKWLISLIGELPDTEKLLVICKTRALAEDIVERIGKTLDIKIGLFHEDLTLLQRDRNAAYFAEPEGARVLVCSEIGSEGRNFQFAHHLVLYDLPAIPDLLEQRIGRLDRIGQTSTIHIHVPYFKGTPEETAALWYHEGLDAFTHHAGGAGEIVAKLGEIDFSPANQAALIAATKKLREEVSEKLAKGQDRLLALSSAPAKNVDAILARIRARDADVSLEEYFLRVFDHFGLHVEDLSHRTYCLLPGNLITDSFPALNDEGLSATFDRTTALSREDLDLLTSDHPVISGALELLLSSEAGNCTFGVWEESGENALLLEVYFVAECIAPPALHADRFLPPTPVRILVDHSLNDLSTDRTLVAPPLRPGEIDGVLSKPSVKRQLLPAMLEQAQKLARKRMAKLVATATKEIEKTLGSEIARLQDLAAVNDHIRPEEIAAMEAQQAALLKTTSGARLRSDAVRLILRKA